MKPTAVVYATGTGHTRRIAEAVAQGLRQRGLAASGIIDLVQQPAASGFEAYGAVVLVAPCAYRADTRPKPSRSSKNTAPNSDACRVRSFR